VSDRVYWDLDFPDRGHEDDTRDEKRLVDGFEEVMLAAVERRLRADVPVAAYLSGGVDSSTVVAMATRLRGAPPAAFTVQVASPGYDETRRRTSSPPTGRKADITRGQARWSTPPALDRRTEPP
jgi:asparagine synthase (glutamine-hydrolysing)